jgi:molybdate transport system substrate-binding protein
MTKIALRGLTAVVMTWAICAPAAELIVSAAASLTNAFSEIGKEFEKANPPHKVIFNFASSGALLQQISRGAPVDVFASADQETMDRADRQQLIVRSSRSDFTANTLVLVAPAQSGISLSGFEGLRSDAFKRIAISNPETVPVGKYAKGALEAAGVFGELKDKYINTQSVRQSVEYVVRGEVDVGFVYASDAATVADRVKLLLEVPTNTPITYPIAAVKGGGREHLAIRFVQFVRSPKAQTILQKHGFKAMK